MSSISVTGMGSMARVPGTRAVDGENAVEQVGLGTAKPAGQATARGGRHRKTPRSRGTGDMRRLRFLPVIGVLGALILTVTGCCAGYCSSSPPPVGGGVQHAGQVHVADR